MNGEVQSLRDRNAQQIEDIQSEHQSKIEKLVTQFNKKIQVEGGKIENLQRQIEQEVQKEQKLLKEIQESYEQKIAIIKEEYRLKQLDIERQFQEEKSLASKEIDGINNNINNMENQLDNDLYQ